MKRITILLLSLLFVVPLFSQDPDIEKYLRKKEGAFLYPNSIKINTLAIALNNISLTYERGIAPRLSVLVSGGYKYQGREPKAFVVNGSAIDAKLDKITGWSFTPELRYYLESIDKRQLRGFYIGLYFRYTHFSSGAEFDYFPEGAPMEFYTSDVVLTEVGAGIQLGYQLQLWKRLSIDFMFFGPRYSIYNMVYEFDKNVSQAFLDDLSDYVNDVIDRFGLDYDVELKQSGDSRASNSFTFANMRFGIGVGFAF